MTFDEAYAQVVGRTMLSAERARLLFDSAQKREPMGGYTVEVGVCRGGSLRLMALARPGCTAVGFDTFDGIVNPDTPGGFVGGEFPADFEDVGVYLSDLPLVKICKGVFPGSYQQYVADHDGCRIPVTVAHCDCDVFAGTDAFIETFLPCMLPGGVMVFDDYGRPSCAGVTIAVDRWFPSWRVTKYPDYQVAVFF
jgi:hypothetical protein